MSAAVVAPVSPPWREAPRPRWRGVAVVVALHAVVGVLLWTGLGRPAPPQREMAVVVSLLPDPAPLRPRVAAPPQPVVKAAPRPPQPDTAPPVPVPPKVLPVVPPPVAPPRADPALPPRADSPVLPTAAAAPTAPIAPAAAVTPTAPAPAPRVAPAPAPASPAPTASPSGPLRQAVAVACPMQAPAVTPRRAIQDGIEGVVTVRLLIRDGRVADVTFLSVPVRGVFESAVRAALARYRCQSPPGQDVEAEQEFQFVLSE